MSNDSVFDNIAINVVLHSLILFVFLSCFFYFYISNIVSKHLSDEFVDFAHDAIDEKYDNMSLVDKQRFVAVLNTMPISTIMKMYDKPDPVKVENNYYNKLTASLVAIGMLAVLIAMVVTYKFRCHRAIHGKHIIVENIIVFICVMGLELGFFVLVASQFIPVMPSSTIKDIISRVKSNFKSS